MLKVECLLFERCFIKKSQQNYKKVLDNPKKNSTFAKKSEKKYEVHKFTVNSISHFILSTIAASGC